MEDGFDKKLAKTLNETPVPSEEALNTMWAGIEDRIDFDKKTIKDSENMICDTRKKQSNRRFLTRVSTGIAAAFILALMLLAPPVRAMIDEVISFFGANNSQDYYTVNEGSKRVDAAIYESKLGYITYFDKEYFDVTKTDEMDRFVPKADNGKGSGHSFLEVKLLKNTTVQETADTVAKEFKQSYTDVIVAGEEDIKNNSYLFNPLDGITVQAFNSTSKGARKIVDRGSFIEFYSIAELKGVGIVSISYKYNAGDEDTAWRLLKLYHDIKIINEDTEKYIEQGPNLLAFDYDQNKYKLTKLRGEQYTYLSSVSSTGFDPGILSVGHFYNKDIEKAADEVAIWSEAERKPTDIALKSVMLVSKSNRKIYLIDDGQGGVFQLYLNVGQNEDIEKILDSLRIVPQRGNEELMKPEELAPNALG